MTADFHNLRTLDVEAVISRVQGHPQLHGILDANFKHLNLGLNLTSTKKMKNQLIINTHYYLQHILDIDVIIIYILQMIT